MFKCCKTNKNFCCPGDKVHAPALTLGGPLAPAAASPPVSPPPGSPPPPPPSTFHAPEPLALSYLWAFGHAVPSTWKTQPLRLPRNFAFLLLQPGARRLPSTPPHTHSSLSRPTWLAPQHPGLTSVRPVLLLRREALTAGQPPSLPPRAQHCAWHTVGLNNGGWQYRRVVS